MSYNYSIFKLMPSTGLKFQKTSTSGPNSKDEVGCYPDLNGSEICENVIYLGKQGSFTTNEGLRIAYMSGVNGEDPLAAKEYNYSVQNLQSLEVNNLISISHS